MGDGYQARFQILIKGFLVNVIFTISIHLKCSCALYAFFQKGKERPILCIETIHIAIGFVMHGVLCMMLRLAQEEIVLTVFLAYT
jgi:hypothetical protein